MKEKEIVISWRSSFDGLLAAWIARTLIPEWAGVTLQFARSVEEADQLEREGALVLNIGTGKFSGHPHDLYPNDCASTLLAKAYGLDEDQKLARLLELALVSDKMPVGDVFKSLPQEAQERAKSFLLSSMPAAIKLLHDSGQDPMAVYGWAAMFFGAEYAIQKRFFDEAVPEFEKTAIRIESRGRPMCAIRSDNDRIHKVAQSQFGGRQHLLFQMQSSGNWAVFGFRSMKTPSVMESVVAVLRHAEMVKRGAVLVSDWEVLQWDGTLKEVPQINFHRQGSQIFNGSLTHPDVEPTRLGFEEIWELIQVALDPKRRSEYRKANRL